MRDVLIMADAKRAYFEEAVRKLEGAGIAATFGDPLRVSEGDLIAQAKGKAAVIAGSEGWSKEVMERCPDLRLIVRCGTGYDGVDVAAATECGILAANTPGLNTYAVAEMALTMILALQRRLKEYDLEMEHGEWQQLAVGELRGKTVGLLGFGGIARKLAGLLMPFSCRILAYDVYKDEAAAAKLGAEYVELDQLLAESDVMSLHLPLLEETRHMICKRTLGLMKPGAVLVNTSRGGIVDVLELYQALKDNRLGGAALDVHEIEPVPENYLLRGMPNVILSPHVASATKEATVQMIEESAEAVIAYFNGGKPEHLLNCIGSERES